jgi:thiamine pyrophosphate-dependent acetolactate synthase large subunit-like protein
MNGEIKQKRTLDKNGNWLLTNVYFVDGKEVTAAKFKKALPDAKAQIDPAAERLSRKRAYPIKSEAAAVHPKQREEAIAFAKKRGVPTYHDRHGRPVFTSARHQAAYLKLVGMFNKDGVFSGQSRTYRPPEQPFHPDL